MMNKGIVMDIKKHSVVVLTPNGEFITFKRKVHSYMIGEEISFNEQEQRAPRFSIPSFLKPASLLVTCFLCVLLFFHNQTEEKVFAYVSVDINPSLEVSVTKDLRVIDLRACNDDGRRILKEMKRWENKHLQDVIRTIIKQSQEDKYLTNDKQVMLTAVTKEKSLEPQLEKAMQKLKKEYETKHVTVVYQNSTMQMRENAMKAGVGTGVYIKQENENTPPSTSPSNQEQPNSSPDVSPEASPVKEERYEKQEYIEQKQSKQIKENNGHQQENNGRESQQENNGRGSQEGNNGHQQENNGRGSQEGNNGHQQENNGRESQGNNGHQQENNGRESQGNNGHQQENNGRESQGNNGHQQENNGRESQGNNGHQQENNGRGSQQGNSNENNELKNDDKNIHTTQHQGNGKKNL
ncbi:membrane protein [Bacillus mycoides]|uniref:Membrane protein n=3 Tax=Bacillus cereus group TaxID=86661 RepID=A0A1E8B546_BACMY|nr:membrane protein [Bacillus mycoides]OFD76412.1 membrane protein [Bacillus mycoides]OFD77876.1 membrane protein [Bacillus mycoides]